MVKVKVLPVPKAAFNPSRPVSSLLKSQIAQLQDAVLEAVDSEEEAAHSIRVLTKLLEDLRPQTRPRSHGPVRKKPRSARPASRRKPTTAKKRTAATRTTAGRKRR